MAFSRVKTSFSDRATSSRIVIATGLLTVLILFLFVQGAQTDTESHYGVLDQLRTAEQLDHKIKEAVMSSHSFKSERSDLILQAIQQTSILCDELKSSVLLNVSAATSFARDEYCTLAKERTDLVEKFGALNSQVEVYSEELPQLVEQIRETALRERAHQILQEGTIYQMLPVEERRQLVEKSLVQFSKSKSASAAAFSKRMDLALEAIDLRLSIERQIFLAIFSQSFLQLRDSYFKSHQALEEKSYAYRIGLLVFCGFLVFGLYHVLSRLRRTTIKLSLLNQNLERRVSDRTQELSTALAELRRQQLALTQKTKMSALGEMAGGIAHEINTPLAAISLNIELLHAEAEERNMPDFQKSLQSVVRIVDRISKIVMGLRRFSRDGSQEPRRPVPVSEVIEDTLILCRERFKIYGVEVKVSIEDPEALISCTPEQIAQVLLNLLNNGFDAVAKLPHKWVRLETSSNHGLLTIRISDSGPGIPLEVQAKLMQPFFTTKEIGKGTGLGLSISKGIIEGHGGRMTYDPKASTTTFIIELPQVSLESLVA